MTSPVVYSLIVAFLSGLGYFMLRYYSKDPLDEARLLGRDTFYASSVSSSKYELLMEILDDPEIFENCRKMSEKDWDYSAYLKAWNEDKFQILDRYKHNQTKLVQYHFLEVAPKLLWPIIILLFVNIAMIPIFILGYFSIVIFYYFNESASFYIYQKSGLLLFMMAGSIHDYGNGNRNRIPKHYYFYLTFWWLLVKGFWAVMNQPAVETKDQKSL